MKHKFFTFVSLCVLVTLCASACGSTAVPSPTPTTETSDLTPEVTMAVDTEETPVVSATEPTTAATVEAYPGWGSYSNAEYGFKLRYPPSWQIEEGENVLRLNQQTPAQTLQININYRHASEDIDLWGRTGIPAGKLETRGTTTMLGHTVLKKVLIYEDKDKALFYNNGHEIAVDDMFFIITLEASGATYPNIDISIATQVETNQILASLKTDAFASQENPELTYINADYGFSFNYPETWTLLQDAHFIRLTHDMSTLDIRYRRGDEEIEDWGKIGLPAGNFESKGQSVFLGQILPQETLVYEKKSKAVYYNGVGSEVRSGGLAFIINLQDLNNEYLEVDLTEELLNETDQILSSFLLSGPAIWTTQTDGGNGEGLQYTNQEYGFSLLLPQRWEGYQDSIAEGNVGMKSVDFWFEGLKPKVSLKVYVHTKEEWISAQNQLVYLGENDQYVFASDPYNPECTNMEAFQCERHKEIPSILNSFTQKAVQGESTKPATVACAGGNLWLDVWPVNSACGNNEWSATLFAEAHGGDCSYTYYWKGEVVGGPTSDSISFDVNVSDHNTIMGEVSVTSGDQTTGSPVYIPANCP